MLLDCIKGKVVYDTTLYYDESTCSSIIRLTFTDGTYVEIINKASNSDNFIWKFYDSKRI